MRGFIVGVIGVGLMVSVFVGVVGSVPKYRYPRGTSSVRLPPRDYVS